MDRNADLKSYAGKEIRANRKYKDTVFRMLFSDRENLLSLYNAVNGSNYENYGCTGDCDTGECSLYG